MKTAVPEVADETVDPPSLVDPLPSRGRDYLKVNSTRVEIFRDTLIPSLGLHSGPLSVSLRCCSEY